MKLIISGGGDKEDSKPFDELFASWIGDGTLLYLPFASRDRGDGYSGHLTWIRSVFEPLGLSNIQMWTSFEGHQAAELASFAGVYIGGGNTYKMLQRLKQTGYDQALMNYLKSDGAIYGGSAGAIIMGHSIDSCAHDDPNDVGLDDTSGLNLLNGQDVWCHYTPQQAEAVQKYCDQTGRATYALSERSGLRGSGNSVASVGFEDALLFKPS